MPLAVRAAVVVLDRTGFGAQTTVYGAADRAAGRLGTVLTDAELAVMGEIIAAAEAARLRGHADPDGRAAAPLALTDGGIGPIPTATDTAVVQPVGLRRLSTGEHEDATE